MPAAEPGQYIYYCDANCVGGNCCNEYDINEMNDARVHSLLGSPSQVDYVRMKQMLNVFLLTFPNMWAKSWVMLGMGLRSRVTFAFFGLFY